MALYAKGKTAMRSKTGTSTVLLMSIIILSFLHPAASLESAGPKPAMSGSLREPTPLAGDAANSRSYELKLSAECKGKLAVSEMLIFEPALFASPWDFGVSSCIRLSYGLTNLSARELHVLVNYRTEPKGKGGSTGTGACYRVAPGEARIIETIAPIAGFKPLRFILMLVPLDHAPDQADFGRLSENKVLVIDPLPLEVPPLPVRLSTNHPSTRGALELSGVSLWRSNEVNWMGATFTNASDQSRAAGLWVGVNHVNTPAGQPPNIPGGGFFRRESAVVSARSMAVLSVAYELPNSGPHPLLTYEGVEYLRGMPDPAAWRKRDRAAITAATDVNLLGWGAADLVQAARGGECVLVPPVPLSERTNLTAETKSPHFTFRYRPGSAAAREIELIVAAREGVYKRLSTLYKIQLPGPVQIDLYPDMEAKGLGSGTSINVANTINASHIAEVYNSMTQVSPGHEIAHIFSFRFPGHGDRGGALGKPGDAFVEGFAGCFEFEDSAETATARLRSRLAGKPAPGLTELIAASSPGVHDEQVVLVDFLTRKSPESFKTFYVQVIARPDGKTVDQAARKAYNVSLQTLENEWGQFLRASSGPSSL